MGTPEAADLLRGKMANAQDGRSPAQRYAELQPHVREWLDELSPEKIRRIDEFFQSYERMQWLSRKLWKGSAWGIGALITMAALGDSIAAIWHRLLNMVGVR